eukprot:3370524-Pleurochrysis_carterae.AAC.1
MDVSLYAEDCEFADPFVSFKGRQRFQDNLQNLAGGCSLLVLPTVTECMRFRFPAKQKQLAQFERWLWPLAASGVPTSYKTRLLVKLQLGLPWKPVLAWPWGVEHVFDPVRPRVGAWRHATRRHARTQACSCTHAVAHDLPIRALLLIPSGACVFTAARRILRSLWLRVPISGERSHLPAHRELGGERWRGRSAASSARSSKRAWPGKDAGIGAT